MIDRPLFKKRIAGLLRSFQAVELVGPRQIGKTTLAREFVAAGSLQYFDLEDPVSRARLAAPMETLGSLEGLVVVDEVQHDPAVRSTAGVDRPARRADVPRITPSMRGAMHDLKLDALYVVYPGEHRFRLADGIEAVPLWALLPVQAALL